MALPDKVRLREHRRIVSQIETRIPRRAFAGATLDLLYSGEEIDALDESTRAQVVAFAEDFLACGCQGVPHCGHPERAFCRYILELRAEGFSPEAIVEAMEADYGLTAYAGDVLSFLDEAVRQLDAMEAIASVSEEPEAASRAADARRALEG